MTRGRKISAEVLAARPQRVAQADGSLRLAAPAKINLDLHVGRARADGFHDVDSAVAKVTLYDDIVLRPRDDGRLVFRCDGADCGPEAGNLAMRAADLLAAEAAAARPADADDDASRPPALGADIALMKYIPPGKGLGGGSSDAASVLLGLDELWGLGLGAERLADLAGRLGSDVPLFLGPRTARMTGRGERLQPLRVRPFVAVLHMPEIPCPTGAVYRQFDELPGRPAELVPPDRAAMGGGPPSTWRKALRNDLAPAAFALHPELRATAERIAHAVVRPVAMTGSGSSLFVLCDDPGEAAEVIRLMPDDLPGRTVVVAANPW